MGDFLAFRRMLTPVLIQVLFWVVLAICFYTGLMDMMHREKLPGLLVILLGPLLLRIVCEVLILFFRINETLTDISHSVQLSAKATETN